MLSHLYPISTSMNTHATALRFSVLYEKDHDTNVVAISIYILIFILCTHLINQIALPFKIESAIRSRHKSISSAVKFKGKPTLNRSA